MNQPEYTCNDCIERLDDYVDRELTEAEAVLVKEHLLDCAGCADVFDFEGHLISELKDRLRRIQIPLTLKAKVTEALGRGRSA